MSFIAADGRRGRAALIIDGKKTIPAVARPAVHAEKVWAGPLLDIFPFFYGPN